MMILGLILQAITAFTPFPHSLPTLFYGHWQSCEEADDSYGERAFQYQRNGRVLFELHMGPKTEFALFAGEVNGDLPHDSPANFLTPAYRYDDLPTRGGRNWSKYGLHINIVRVPASDEDRCFAYLIQVDDTMGGQKFARAQ